MRYRDSQLRGVPAFTEDGRRIGRLVGLVVDAATHEVVQYAVRRSVALARPLPSELLVDRRQVVSLDDRSLVVRDAAVAEESQSSKVGQVSEQVQEAAVLNRNVE
ncbi:hypothetical protein COY93_02010 [Candidatus Uhrbacteria bacterium CG_4_10_14_0_8_um_filter_58_22]|uniref:PRC-barrel domain-containing protein n=1 Tax=Candidatus Uhrbacteria bacterium CG_4_10_14_0_8_um_filter_58_22 TaxID=1975029 RepID=A0A2M7QBL8_9BACT|nr:MAG: hypothetical protein AUJ19_02905 [Parcubacteria group bacterium CG1_02_58_44]PIY62864.1 MAG: hypothetical protein COY93_02010 [Candidatus Uhrbacteria bacterium CG_4_10_14_0_8_um_filter_58_22]